MANIEVGQTIMLMGITRHGRNRVKQFGPLWRVTKIQDECPSLKTLPPFVLLEAGGDLRWISLEGDNNFKIVGIQQDMF